jgi:hypothetical protein
MRVLNPTKQDFGNYAFPKADTTNTTISTIHMRPIINP